MSWEGCAHNLNVTIPCIVIPAPADEGLNLDDKG